MKGGGTSVLEKTASYDPKRRLGPVKLQTSDVFVRTRLAREAHKIKLTIPMGTARTSLCVGVVDDVAGRSGRRRCWAMGSCVGSWTQ